MNPSIELYQSIFSDAYEFFNKELFNDSLPQCLIIITRKKRVMGHFSPNRWVTENGDVHELAINTTYLNNRPIIEAFQTIVHEMVHCQQHIYGKPSRSGYHNKEWADMMIAVGLMPSSTGKEGGAITGQNMNDYPIDGGRFQVACAKLIKKGFKLTIIDRTKAPVSGLDTTTSISLDTLINPEIDGFDEEVVKGLYMPPTDGINLISEPTQKNNKVKYSCGCSNFWGSSQILATCNKCGKEFEAVKKREGE